MEQVTFGIDNNENVKIPTREDYNENLKNHVGYYQDELKSLKTSLLLKKERLLKEMNEQLNFIKDKMQYTKQKIKHLNKGISKSEWPKFAQDKVDNLRKFYNDHPQYFKTSKPQ